MTEASELTVTEDEEVAHLLLLWLLIHGGDPYEHGDDNPVEVSDAAVEAARALVTQLSHEFADTKITDRSDVAARLQQRLNVSPTAVGETLVVPDQVICVRFGEITICFRVVGVHPPNPGPIF